MSIEVKIPAQLRQLTGGESTVSVEDAENISELIERLGAAHPELQERLLDESGEIRRFINVYVGDEDIRFMDGLSTKVASGETVSILPAVAGGFGPLGARPNPASLL